MTAVQPDPDLRIGPEPFDSPAARTLIAAVQQEYVVRYGGEDLTPTDAGEFAPPDGLFLIARSAGRPVGCGGWRVHSADDGADADAVELKRMYVVPAYRRRGLGRLLLDALERTAAAAGHRRVVLETGTRQPEAMAMYVAAGYRPAAAYGLYRDGDGTRCFGKDLAER